MHTNPQLKVEAACQAILGFLFTGDPAATVLVEGGTVA